MNLKVQNVKPTGKQNPIARFDLYLPELDMTIKECSLLAAKGTHFISWPQRAYDDKVTGAKKYFSYIFVGKEKMDLLGKKMIPLVLEQLNNSHNKQDGFDETIGF